MKNYHCDSKKVHCSVFLPKIAPSFLQHERSQWGRGGEETKAIHLGYFPRMDVMFLQEHKIRGQKTQKLGGAFWKEAKC
jgi:hypothetical protein